jgi:hypothetical protein
MARLEAQLSKVLIVTSVKIESRIGESIFLMFQNDDLSRGMPRVSREELRVTAKAIAPHFEELCKSAPISFGHMVPLIEKAEDFLTQ